MLLPISMLESRLSYLSDSFRTRSARLSPSCAIFLIFILFSDVNAVSVAEKYAESTTSTMMAMTAVILWVSILCIPPLWISFLRISPLWIYMVIIY